METTRLWLEESNITHGLIAFVEQNSSHFFREGIRLNSDAYVELLTTVVNPWIAIVANGRPYVWQQVSAPATLLGKIKYGCSRKNSPTTIFYFSQRIGWGPNPAAIHMAYYWLPLLSRAWLQCLATPCRHLNSTWYPLWKNAAASHHPQRTHTRKPSHFGEI